MLRSDDPRVGTLMNEGWRLTARSWGAELDAGGADTDRLANRLRELVARARHHGQLRELGNSDVTAVLALDAATIDDYPGGPATGHAALTQQTAATSETRRAFGALTAENDLAAVTYVDIDLPSAETDFTVVRRDWRGRGLGTAVKASSVLALLASGVTRFRTGGSSENVASMAANASVGYRIDEEWLTLRHP
ncbi:hypothetical protein GCM10027568_25040 [Humibacter soli]